MVRGMSHEPFVPGAPPTTDIKVGNGAEVLVAWILAVITAGYMLPWAVAASRGKSNSTAIGLVNFFAGWTVLGWIAALIMACGAHQPIHPAAASVSSAWAPGWYPNPEASGTQRYWDGRIWTEHTLPDSGIAAV